MTPLGHSTYPRGRPASLLTLGVNPPHRVVPAHQALHAYFLDRLVPACQQLLDAAVAAGETAPGTHAYELMRGIGNLCIARDSDPRYDPRRLVGLLLSGLRAPPPS